MATLVRAYNEKPDHHYAGVGSMAAVGVLHFQHGCCRKEIKDLNICIQLYGLFSICTDCKAWSYLWQSKLPLDYTSMAGIINRYAAIHCSAAPFRIKMRFI